MGALLEAAFATNGKIRDVERYGNTKAAAQRLLLEHLRERVTPAPADAMIKPTMLLKGAAEVWRIEKLESSTRHSANTRKVYASTLRRHIAGGALAHLTVRELKVSNIERALKGIGADSGPGAAKLARSVLGLVLDLCVRHDAIPHNPVRDLGHVEVSAKETDSQRNIKRAFTREERDQVVAFADADPTAQRRDLPDLIAFLAGTGARIGEACGLRWSAVDLEAGTAQLGALPVRIPGQGLQLQEQGKTATSTRTVRLPEWLVARLMARKVNAESNPWDVVFCSAQGKLRDTTNTTKHVRALLDAAGFRWATGHTFRRTVATLLDAAGTSGREVANQLGHVRPSMTMDVYMDRTTITESAASVL